MPTKYKVLITGSSGMLGIALWQELRKDFRLFGIDQAQSPKLKAQSFRCDITDKVRVTDIIAKIKPDLVIHAAAYTNVDGCELDKEKAHRINSEGTKNVALACKKINAILIYISTDFVFDGKKKTSYKEEDKPKPLSTYGDSKLKGEKAIKKILKKYYILRTSWLYGAHGKNFVDIILEKAKVENMLRVVDDQVGSPTHAKDMAKAVHVLLNKVLSQVTSHKSQVYGIYHISNAGSVSWYEYAKEILYIAGSKTQVIPISSKELDRPARRPAMSILDNSKFARFTGYRMRNWKEVLKEYLRK